MITIRGINPTLIALDGDIIQDINVVGNEVTLGFSDGTLINCFWDGIWKFHIVMTGLATIANTEAELYDFDDVMELIPNTVSPITWVVAGPGTINPAFVHLAHLP